MCRGTSSLQRRVLSVRWPPCARELPMKPTPIFQRRYTRRAVLGTLAAIGAAPLLGRKSLVADASAALSCSLAPSMTEGPFFVDEKLKRFDLTSDTTDSGTLMGLPLYLNIGAVSTTSG